MPITLPTAATLTNPPSNWKQVTPSNSADLPDGTCRALYCSADGNVRVTDAGGNTNTLPLLKGMNVGLFRRVHATGTDAITIWACY